MRKNDPINNVISSEIEAVQHGQLLSDVYKIMCNSGIHHVPVLDGEKLIGLISATDMMKINMSINNVNERNVGSSIDAQSDIEGIMTIDLVTVNETGTLRDLSSALGKGEFHSLPVINVAAEQGVHKIVMNNFGLQSESAAGEA